MSARARPRVTLRMALVLFSELLFFFCFGSQTLRPLLKAQLFERILLLIVSSMAESLWGLYGQVKLAAAVARQLQDL